MKRLILMMAVLLCSGLGFAQMGKLDPRLGLLWQYPERLEYETETRQMLFKSASQTLVEAIVTRDQETVDFQAAGARIVWQRGELSIVRCPADRLADLAALPGVLYVEAPQLSRARLDESVPMIGAPQVWSSQGLTGKNVLVGVIDSGIDWQHPAFRHNDGSTRIRYLLDMSESGGFYGGRLYTEGDINAALQSSSGVNERDYSGHGTHVAGIMAGNGASTQNAGTYTGVAPDADLVVVKAARNSLGTDFRTTDQMIALSFVDSVAAVLGRPWVANLSLGGHAGAHDGTASVERFIDTLTGSGKPGKAVVTVSGNEGNNDIHAKVILSGTAKKNISIVIPSFVPSVGSGNDVVQLSIWYSGTVMITVVTPNGLSYGPVRAEQVSENKGSDGSVYIWNGYYEQNGSYRPGVNPFNGDREAFVEINDAPGAGLPAIGEWTIECSGKDAVVDAYVANTSLNAEFVQGKVDFGKLSIPGTSEQALTVAAYTSKITWTDLDGNRLTIGNNSANRVNEISPFSSPGPTRTAKFVKPDVAAPGQMIASAASEDAPPSSPSSVFHSGSSSFPNGFITQDLLYGLSSGTSMAAPHIAGACALIFEKYPDLTVSQVRDLLTRGAQSDDHVGLVPNNTWGWGKADISRALSMEPGEDPYADIDNLTAYPNPFMASTGTKIVYRLPENRSRLYTTVHVYNMLGQQVRTLVSGVRPSGLNQEPWDGRNDLGYRTVSGVYFVEIVSGDHRQVIKLAYLGYK